MSISVFYACIDPLLDENTFHSYFEQASKERKDKILKCRLFKDRARSLGVEILLKKALADRGLEIKDLSFSYGPFGKPYLADPEDLYFSLSHSGSYVMCAVSDQEIGCDIEKVREVNEKVTKRFFTPEEYESVFSLSSAEDRADLFFKYWTAKESLMKCTGLGMSLLSRSSTLSSSYFFKEIAVAEGYRACICQAAEITDFSVFPVSF